MTAISFAKSLTCLEALSDGGVRMGLPRQVATALAAQTVLGAGEMVLSSGEHPGVLRDRVASPGGTTIAGLQALEQGGLRLALTDITAAPVCAKSRSSSESSRGRRSWRRCSSPGSPARRCCCSASALPSIAC